MNKHDIEAIVRPSPYGTLTVQYALMALYGVLSGWMGVTTLDRVTGDLFGVVWPILVVATSLAALVGITFARMTGTHRVEIPATLALIVLLATYSVAIVLRAASDTDYTGLPFAVLPLALCVYPYTRLLSIVRTWDR